MNKSAANENPSKPRVGSSILLSVVIVVGVLYFARVVVIPLALAVLFAFLFAPLVIRLRCWGLGRVFSSILVVSFSFLIMSVIGTVMSTQLTDLAHKMPEYEQNVQHKVQSIRATGGSWLDRISRVVGSLTDGFAPTSPTRDNRTGQQKPVQVEIHKPVFAPMDIIQKALGSVLNVMLTLGIVVVFVIFMLIEREDLRDRLIRLAGPRRLTLTTRALDEASDRLSRYLVVQLLINIVYGVLAGIGLYFMRVPNPLLWGIVAALMRYIPYLGIWIAAAMPAALAFAVEPGWLKAPIIFGLYFGIDLLMYYIAEPLLYEQQPERSLFTGAWGP